MTPTEKIAEILYGFDLFASMEEARNAASLVLAYLDASNYCVISSSDPLLPAASNLRNEIEYNGGLKGITPDHEAVQRLVDAMELQR